MCKLTIELVPETSWFNNVRSFVSKLDWEKLKQATFAKADHKCEICGGAGSRWPVECHEIWEYDDQKRHQILKGLTALCPDCHEVKHIGYANTRGRGEIAIEHLADVNNWSLTQAEQYVDSSFDIWEKRNKHYWGLNLDYLDNLDVTIIMPEGVYKTED